MKNILEWSSNYPLLSIPILLVLSFFLYRFLKLVIARSAYAIAIRSENIYDDLIVDRLQPFRFLWVVPLLVIYFYSPVLYPDLVWVAAAALVLSIWAIVDLLGSLLNGVNDVYRNNPRYQGVSIAGYIGLVKVVIILAGIVLSISIIFEVAPLTLLSGVGAWLAVLLLIFRDTILSFMASVQISSQQLLKEGDMIDVPAYGASGTVASINLQVVSVQNFDNTVTYIPTYKMTDISYKNYRVMTETGARRLKRTITFDVDTIRFLETEQLERLQEKGFLSTGQLEEVSSDGESGGATNLELYMTYCESYLKKRKEVIKRRYPFVVRILEMSVTGVPLEIYVFVKAKDWSLFEAIHSEIMIHLLAVSAEFGLKMYTPRAITMPGA